MAKKVTSFFLEADDLRLLKLLAENFNRNQGQQITVLIRESAKKEKIK